MTVLVNQKNCPVCLVVNDRGFGDAQNIAQPCRYPWQTPIGVLAYNVAEPTVASNATVQESGTFTVQSTDIAQYQSTILGGRVYYDAGIAKYRVENTGPRPGAATVGYISEIHTTDVDTYVTITIDPRPARSQYRVANYAGSSALSMGKPVTISSPDNVATPYTATNHTCDGVVVGMLGDDHVIVCVAGPAWVVGVSEEQLYAVCDYDDIVDSGFPPKHVPINANLAFMPFDGADVPRIGFVHWDKWYHDEDDPETEHDILVDVAPECPTVLVEAEPEPESLQTTMTYIDPEGGVNQND